MRDNSVRGKTFYVRIAIQAYESDEDPAGRSVKRVRDLTDEIVSNLRQFKARYGESSYLSIDSVELSESSAFWDV